MASHDAHEKVPLRTTPQGSQEEGVERGHDAIDISFQPVFKWFAFLILLVVGSQLLLWAAIALWDARAEQRDVLPSPLYGMSPPPPTPRVLPNRVDSPSNVREPMKGPGEELEVYRKREAESLERIGLWDRSTGRPALPDRAVEAVTREAAASGAPTGQGTGQMMPSSASGGRAVENWLPWPNQ
jgi:hypothetical protein